MSNQSSTDRKKKLVTATSSIFKQLNSRQGRKLDKRLNSPEMLDLLRRIAQGNVRRDFANSIASGMEGRGEVIAGPLKRVLDIGSIPKAIHMMAFISTSDKTFTREYGVMSFLAKGTVHLILTRKNTGAICRTLRYRPEVAIYGVRTRVKELPVDLRQWPNSLLQSYLQTLYSHHSYGTGNKNTGYYFAREDRPADTMHSIRRINVKPSKTQHKRVEEQRQKNYLQDSEADLADE